MFIPEHFMTDGFSLDWSLDLRTEPRINLIITYASEQVCMSILASDAERLAEALNQALQQASIELTNKKKEGLKWMRLERKCKKEWEIGRK